MRRKLLGSMGAVIALSAISIAAYASSFSESEHETNVQSTPVLITTEIPATYSPEPTTEAVEPEPKETTDTLIMSRDWDAEESYLLAKLAMAEAEGEDTEGKALVMLVVLNRVWSEEFPNTIKEVIFQQARSDGTWQFSPMCEGGRWYTTEPDADCYKALEMIQADGWDGSEGALYFESKSESTWHGKNLKYLFKHGAHYF